MNTGAVAMHVKLRLIFSTIGRYYWTDHVSDCTRRSRLPGVGGLLFKSAQVVFKEATMEITTTSKSIVNINLSTFFLCIFNAFTTNIQYSPSKKIEKKL